MENGVNILLNNLPEYRGENILVTRQQETFDIIKEIMAMHENCVNHYDNIALYHWRGNPLHTAQHLFYFLRNNVPYKEEKTQRQTVKEPQAILAERLTFGNDCKHYASYIVGVCEALRRLGYPIKSFYRFASYSKHNKTPGHVFSVAVIDGREYWIDPVPQIGGFDCRKIKPVYSIDKIAPMAKKVGSLYKVGNLPKNWHLIKEHRYGSGSSHGGGHGHHAKMVFVPAPRHSWLDSYYGGGVGKVKKHHHGLHLKINPGQLFKKYNPVLASSRNAFLAYLKLNLFHTGSHMYSLAQSNKQFRDKLFNTWRKVGGNGNKLQTALSQARNVWNKHHKNFKLTGDVFLHDGDASVGFAPLAIPAVIAAAAPMIAVFKNIMKEFGIPHADGKNIADAEEKTISDHNDATSTKGDGNKDINPDGSVDHGNGITTKVQHGEDGTPALKIHANDDGGDGGGGNDGGGVNKAESKEVETPPSSTADNSFGMMTGKIIDYVKSHKWYFIGGGLVVVGLIVIPKVLAHKKRRR